MNANELALFAKDIVHASVVLAANRMKMRDSERDDFVFYCICFCVYEIMTTRGFVPYDEEGETTSEELNAMLERLQRRYQEARN